MGARIFALVRAAIVAALFVSIWTWFLPRWLMRGELVPHGSAPAIVLMTTGGLIMLRCVWEFAWTGRGTPAPFDPPRRLVVRGLYRWVRNPMYAGMALFLVGEAILLPAITKEMLIMLAIFAAITQCFVVFYEEPALRAKFGDDYAEYCRHVRRWIPRLTPFDTGTRPAVP